MNELIFSRFKRWWLVVLLLAGSGGLWFLQGFRAFPVARQTVEAPAMPPAPVQRKSRMEEALQSEAAPGQGSASGTPNRAIVNATSSPWGSPRGLAALVDEALSGSDAVPLLDLVAALRTCFFMPLHEEQEERSVQLTGDARLRQAHLAKYQRLQRQHVDCQTLPADASERQLRLARLAADRGIEGAAAELLTLQPMTPAQLAVWMPQVVKDAQAGDWSSLTHVLARSPVMTNLTPSEFQALALAVHHAKGDAQLGIEAKARWQAALSWSRSFGARGEPIPPLEVALAGPISPEASMEAQRLLSKWQRRSLAAQGR